MKQLPAGVVNIRGKEYQTVALRVHTFREQFPSYSLLTEVLHRDLDCVVMKASIVTELGRVLATGHAEEYRKASEINKTSALENAETSAIGRALAALGIGGTEFASADEVARAVSGQKGEAHESSLTMLPTQHQATIRRAAAAAIEAFNEGKEVAAYEEVSSCIEAIGGGDAIKANQAKLALWEILRPHSALRATIKRLSEQDNKA